MLLTIEEIEATLRESLPGLPVDDVHRTARAIVERSGVWREVDSDQLGAQFSVQCRDICAVGEAVQDGMRIRAFVSTD